ncbi:MAG: hypothetical protein EXR05_10865 [Acetobacteraceae bacterium]|nr:hypothetical protein [Acetobacteraceae bacterium]MSP30487.1 hypothetical protein [Acetobacteraceae bacterium]
MSEDEAPEAAALQRAAERRLLLADADPADTASLAAARHLQTLADALRAMPDNPEWEQYRCLCHWLSASDGITDLAAAAHRYNATIGFGEWPETALDYVRVLNRLANQLING